MKTAIVITSIQSPTSSVLKFCKLAHDSVVVVGDRKTPHDWKCFGAHYISIAEQKDKFAMSLPFDHYCRKMLGYVQAKNDGFSIIYDTDDDNIPMNNWHIPNFEGEYLTLPADLGFVNIYNWFTSNFIWPRGFPLDYVSHDFTSIFSSATRNFNRIGIWQGLANDDPDVDAVYRLIINKSCTFEDKVPIVLSKFTVSPFNSQNTFFKKECFALLYIPSTVTFRFCDILRGLVAQPCLWASGLTLGFFSPTVTQVRNIHSLINDFTDEIPMYKYASKVVDIISNVIRPENSVSSNLFDAYEKLYQYKIVKKVELYRLDLWLKNIE